MSKPAEIQTFILFDAEAGSEFHRIGEVSSPFLGQFPEGFPKGIGHVLLFLCASPTVSDISWQEGGKQYIVKRKTEEGVSGPR